MLPGVRIDPYRRELRAWARALRKRLGKSDTSRARVEVIADYMSGELGFRGNTSDYHNPRNSYLPAVMDSRLGIPISLSVVYMAVAQLAGVLVEGVNLPGHFIVKHADVLFDPFHDGKVLTLADCAEILTGQGLELQAHHIAAASSRVIFIRTLANLLYSFEVADDTIQKQKVSQWIRLLSS